MGLGDSPARPGLVQVLMGDVLQIEVKLCRGLGHVPEDVAELFGNAFGKALVRVAVAKVLLVFVNELAHLAGQAEDRNGDVGAHGCGPSFPFGGPAVDTRVVPLAFSIVGQG